MRPLCAVLFLLLAIHYCDPQAQARTMQQKLDAACAPAAERLCAGAKADPDALKACLLSHRDAVDEACIRLVDASE